MYLKSRFHLLNDGFWKWINCPSCNNNEKSFHFFFGGHSCASCLQNKASSFFRMQIEEEWIEKTENSSLDLLFLFEMESGWIGNESKTKRINHIQRDDWIISFARMFQLRIYDVIQFTADSKHTTIFSFFSFSVFFCSSLLFSLKFSFDYRMTASNEHCTQTQANAFAFSTIHLKWL